MGERTYAENRNELEGALRELARLGDERSEPGAAEGARSLLKKLAEERFNVVVVGEFKRGKTTFVNALLGADLLPSAVVPLTSIVTAVAWGEEPRAEVSFADGRTENVPVGELARYVTERENPKNGLGVDREVLYHPAEELRDGVFLIDTPGVGSVYRHNAEAARAFVPESDAAVFLTSADPPISEGERLFLEEVRAEAARMFFVLNKVDHLSERDRAEALAFTRQVIGEALGSEPRVYPVSARQALNAKVVGDSQELEESGLAAFERDFRRFLARDKGQVIVASVAGHARKLAADARNALDIERRALQIPIEELTDQTREMERVFAEALRSRDDIRALLRRDSEALVKLVEDDLARLRQEATPQILTEAGTFLDARGEARGAAEAVDQLGQDSIRRTIERWRGEEDRRVGEAFRQATARHVEETDRLVERTVRLCGELLQIELVSVEVPGGISPETRFTYSFFEVPTILESLLPDVGRFLPEGLARKRQLKVLREKIPPLIDKHSGRLRWDFVQRLDRSRRRLEGDLDERLKGTIESLRTGVRRALDERSRSEDELGRRMTLLETDRRALGSLDTRLALLLELFSSGGGESQP
jgi:GTPase SAR1 family protein